MRADDLVFVDFSHYHIRDEDFPYADARMQAHGMASAIPVVEMADHADAGGVRRPHGKARAGDTIEAHGMSALHLIKAHVPPFTDQMPVELAKHAWQAVGVLTPPHPAFTRQ